MDRGVWGVDVRSLDSGERLYSLNAGKLMMPASNMKILTVAAGAEVLGWDYRFTTTLETAGTIAGGVLRGDLFVRSNGDPSINTREGRADAVLYEWARALQAAGISSIEGRIIGDDQAFDDEGIGAGWAWDYLQYGYAAPVGALEFNENVATLTIAPGAAAGDPVFVRLTPGSGLAMLNRASTGPAGSEDTLDYRRHLDRATLEVTGSMPAGSAETTRNVAVVNPTLFFAQAVKDGLAARGIAVSGEAADLDDVAASLQARGSARAPRAGVDRVPSTAGHRDGVDEGESEPLRRDAAEGDGRGARRPRDGRGRAARRADHARRLEHSGRLLRDVRRIRLVALQLPHGRRP